MTRNVRNFWIEIEVDGKKTKIATGPVSKDGGFILTIQQRDNGKILAPLRIRGMAFKVTGELKMSVISNLQGITSKIRNGFEIVTKR